GLGEVQDAEDAFQGAFLLLARKAATLDGHPTLAGWLHGVAFRMASNARRAAARRQKHEGKSSCAQPAGPEREAVWRELLALLDEEIQGLPERYRAPFVLCVLEGHRLTEAANRFGVKQAPIGSWVSRARELLRKRLARRGVELPLVLAAATLSSTQAAVVPGALAGATVEAASLYAASGTLAT